ncbi:MAG: hypothetical protein WKF37_09425 [Bryobacteraceae bacterium]
MKIALLKTGRNSRIEHNVFDYFWADGQTKAINLKASNQPSLPRDCYSRLAFPQCYTAKTKNITFRNNIVRNIFSVLAIGQFGGNNGGAGETGPIMMTNNLWLIDRDKWNSFYSGQNDYYILYSGAEAWTFSHNTLFDSTTSSLANGVVQIGSSSPPRSDTVFSSNIFHRGQYGIFASGQAEGNGAAKVFWCGNQNCPPSQFGYNLMIGPSVGAILHQRVGLLLTTRSDFRMPEGAISLSITFKAATAEAG